MTPSNVRLIKTVTDTDNMIEEFDTARELFASRAGSIVATRRTYIPTGKIVDGCYWNDYTRYLSTYGSRIFNAADWDEMLAWMRQYENQSTALDLL